MTEYDPKSVEGIPESGVERLEQNRQGLYTSDLSVNERHRSGIRPGRTRRRQLDLPHRDSGRRPDHQPGARHALAGDVQRAASRDDADGGGGRSARGGRDRRSAPGHRALRMGTEHGRVHRDRHPVKHRDGVLHRAPNGRPFQSDLSGQEFWTLLRTGHRPVGIVMGSCVFHVGRRGPLRTIAQTGRNVELPN